MPNKDLRDWIARVEDIGELKIIELREKAKKALGDKFSLKEFHNVVLDTGTVPLDTLEQQVDSYVRSKGALQNR